MNPELSGKRDVVDASDGDELVVPLPLAPVFPLPVLPFVLFGVFKFPLLLVFPVDVTFVLAPTLLPLC